MGINNSQHTKLIATEKQKKQLYKNNLFQFTSDSKKSYKKTSDENNCYTEHEKKL